MLQRDTNKNSLKLACYGLTVLTFLLSFNKAGNAAPDPKSSPVIPALKELKAIPNTKFSPVTTTSGETKDKDTAGNGVEIIVDNKPLAIPQDFIKTLKSLGITSMTLGDKQGRVRLLKADGSYVNPCASTDKASGSQGTYGGTAQPCRLQAELGETHLMIGNEEGAAAGCGTCQAGGYARVCDKATKKYTCSTKANFCGTNCI